MISNLFFVPPVSVSQFPADRGGVMGLVKLEGRLLGRAFLSPSFLVTFRILLSACRNLALPAELDGVNVLTFKIPVDWGCWINVIRTQTTHLTCFNDSLTVFTPFFDCKSDPS